VPAGVLVVTGGVMAGTLISAAQAAPGLPARTPAQLLVQVADSTTPPLTGTVVETAAFGLPALPAAANPTSLSSLLTGSHTVRVWYSSPEHFRLAVPESMSESDLVRNGSTAWLWQSTLNKVTKYTLPAHSQQAVPKQPLTPQQAAKQVLAAVGPTTTVSVATNVTVAGQPAYALVLAPKDARSLVGQVQIAIDGRNGVPLRLQVFARGASSPAFQVGYTAIQFVTPAPADLSFTPPPGSTVTQVNLTGGHMTKGHQDSGVAAIGSGWLTVLTLPSSTLTSGAPSSASSAPAGGSADDSAAVLRTLLGSATPVHGAWGTGRLLRTSLVSVLITDQGSAYVGAVQPSVLYAAAQGH
jgi:outer membrane lipoprotein-sorting protein